MQKMQCGEIFARNVGYVKIYIGWLITQFLLFALINPKFDVGWNEKNEKILLEKCFETDGKIKSL